MMRFALADEDHDAKLRALASAEPMPGWVRLVFAREPAFFAGIGVQGHENQVVALFDGEEVVGMGCRSTRPMFINGSPREFGYLSGLRSKPRVRLGTLLGRGYRFLYDLHRDGRVPGYLTTIVEHNRSAIELLTSGRAGLPAYLPWGRYYSYAIPPGRVRSGHTANLDIRPGAAVGTEALVSFLTQEGPRKQFFPIIRASDFGRPHLRDLNVSAFRVAVRNGAIVGAAAVWDQRGFRQTVVGGYAPCLHMLRPLVNVPCRIAGYRALPAPGGTLNMAYLAFLCVRDNNPGIFSALLDAVRTELSGSDLHFLCVGLHEDDDLNAVLRKVRHLRYISRLYVVCWDDTRDVCESLRSTRIPYVELATL